MVFLYKLYNEFNNSITVLAITTVGRPWFLVGKRF